MGLFGSVSGKQVDEFARALVDELCKMCPPDAQKSAALGEKSMKNLQRKLDNLCDKAASFRKAHKLGIYKKARLANTFRWELKTRGHDENFIEAVTEKLVVAVSKKD